MYLGRDLEPGWMIFTIGRLYLGPGDEVRATG